MNSNCHPNVFHWSVLAGSVALSAISSDDLAYAAQDIPEPVNPNGTQDILFDPSNAISWDAVDLGSADTETYSDTSITLPQTGPEILGLEVTTETGVNDTATLVFPNMTPGIPQFSDPILAEATAAAIAETQTTTPDVPFKDSVSEETIEDSASEETTTVNDYPFYDETIVSEPGPTDDALTQVTLPLDIETPQDLTTSIAESVTPGTENHLTLDTESIDAEGETTVDNVSLELSQAIANQVEILNPTEGTVVDTPAITVIVRFPANADIELQVNGQSVDNELIGRTESNPTTNLVTQTWYGVPLEQGSNTLTVVRPSDGSLLQSTDVEVRGAPVEMTLHTRESQVPADGRSTVTLQGRLIDSNGNVSNWDSIVTLETTDGEFVGVDYAPDQPGFQVEAKSGRFKSELQSSLEAHMVQLKATTNGLEAFNQVQFATPQRPSIATGIVDLRFGARGTNFHDSLRDFLPPDGNNDYEVDLDASLFTMGNLGEWLLTGAFNSDRPLNEDCRGETALFRQSSGSCNNLYPIYGDDSTQDVTTPSTDHLYLRLERTSPVEGATADYAMWGDYNTEEFANSSQLFTSTSRQLHGFKFNYNVGDLAVTGLYGDNVEGFQRDTIAPDGTSGLYFLSRRLVVSGSEQVYIETEELDRPGTVITRERLHRNTDYDIDYDRGTLLFDDPVTQTATGDFGEVLLRRIVVTYQFDGENTDTNILAGRLQYNFDRTLNQESWLGTSYLRENQGNRDFTLFGADAQVSLGESGRLVGEVAHSESDFDLSGPISGSAYRLELDGSVSDWLSGRAYWRSTDSGFTNAATTSFVPGQTRYGAQANVKLSSNTTFRAQFDHEDNDGVAPRPLTNLEDLLEPGLNPVPGRRVDNSLTTYSVGLAQRLGDSNLEFDWIHRDRTDRTNPETLEASSDQLRTRLTTRLANNLTFRAQNELNLSSESDPLYPSRTYLGLDWEVIPGINLGLGQVFYGDNGFSDRDSYTIVDLSGEHSLGEDTTIRGRFSSIDGQHLGGAIGIEHGFILSPGLRLDLGYERTFNSILGGTAAGTQFSQPFAVGTGGSSLGTVNGNTYTLGLSYTDNPDLQASARFEHRDSSQGSNTGLNASVVGRLSPAVSALFNYQLNRAANQRISNIGTTSNLKLGLAYRDPNDDRFNALLRYEHRINPSTLPTNALFGSSIDTSEHLFSAEALYAPNWRWELYGKYAFRTSQTRISLPADVGGDFTSNNSLHLAQLRATYRLGYSWDISGEARWFGGLGDYSELGYALEAGYYPTPDLRLYGGYSGGGAYDNDFGVNRSASGFYLGVSAKINSLFDGFGLQNVAPEQQRESSVESEEPIIFFEDTTDIIFPGEQAAEETSFETPEALEGVTEEDVSEASTDNSETGAGQLSIDEQAL
ncbi:MAG: TonB-dependent receptor [Cyanobacteria bacterium J06642_11]